MAKSDKEEIKRLKDLIYERIQELRRLEEENKRLKFENSTLITTIFDLREEIKNLKSQLKGR